MTDDELMKGIRGGDEEAFIALYRRHQAGLFRFAWHMSGSPEAAEEIVQDTFVALIRNPGAWRAERGAVRAFLFGIARNHAHRSREDAEEFSELDHDVASAEDLASELARSERAAAVREAVLQLPESYRETVVLCDMEEMSYEDAARVIGCPVGTVRSRLSRGRVMLASRLRAKLAGRPV